MCISDSNNPWSVFNYSIEVKSNGQVGYAKYNKQPQQEFLLEMCIRDRHNPIAQALNLLLFAVSKSIAIKSNLFSKYSGLSLIHI